MGGGGLASLFPAIKNTDMKKLMMLLLTMMPFVAMSQQEGPLDLPKRRAADPDSAKVADDPLRDVMANAHDSTVVAFKSGKIYKLTGVLAGAKDSLAFETFAYQQVKKLTDAQLIALGALWQDSTSFPGRPTQVLCVFRPTIGLELTTLKGKVERYLIALECPALGVLDSERYPMQEVMSKKARLHFEKLRSEAFPPQTLRLQTARSEPAPTVKKAPPAGKPGGQ
jgi:hypothetical protein